MNKLNKDIEISKVHQTTFDENYEKIKEYRENLVSSARSSHQKKLEDMEHDFVHEMRQAEYSLRQLVDKKQNLVNIEEKESIM